MVFSMEMLYVGMLQVFGFFVEGCAGFGASVIASPINAAILGTDVSIPYATLLACPILYYAAWNGRKYISWPDLAKIFAGILPGFLLGNYLGMIMDANIAKLGIGATVTTIALLNIYRHIIKPLVLKIPMEEEKADTTGSKVFRFTCLIVGSIVHGAFTIGGPLITVYTLNAVKDKYRFRNTMLAMWAVLDSFNAFRHAATGLWTPYTLSAVAVALPFTFIGYYFGGKLLHRVNQAQFLRIIYVILLAVGGNMFIQTLISLM